MKKYLLMLLSVVVVGCSDNTQTEVKELPKKVKTITIGDSSGKLDLSFPGKVVAGKEANVTFKVPGRLIEIPVKEGHQIKKGDVIAKLDPKDYRFEYQKKLASYKEKKSSLARSEELIKNRYISQADYDKKKEAFSVAQAELNIAKTNLSYTTLTAPFDGEIAKVYADNFQNVQAQENIATIHNLDFIEINIHVPERVLINTAKAKASSVGVNVHFDAEKSKSYKAEITEISTQANELTQTYEATIRLNRPQDINVLPGMTAIVSISVELNEEELASQSIPADAIFSDSDKDSFVWVVNKENRLEKRQITSASFSGDNVNVKSGLNQGDVVVVAGVSLLRTGQLVAPYTSK